MKFFKHFTDAHRGRSVQAILDDLGHEGHSCFWILVEMCAEKLEKRRDEEYTAEHCKFTFSSRLVRANLRLRSTKVQLLLNSYSVLGLLRFKLDENEIEIEMPKLLESIDRDTNRARPARGQSAAGPRQEKEKEKEEEGRAAKSERSPPPLDRILVTSVETITQCVPKEQWENWASVYDPQYIKLELMKMASWLIANKTKNRKSLKGLTLFVNSWLARDWDKWLNGQPTTAANAKRRSERL